MALPTPGQIALDNLLTSTVIEGIPKGSVSENSIKNLEKIVGTLKLPANPDTLLVNITANVIWEVTDSSGNKLTDKDYLFSPLDPSNLQVEFLFCPKFIISSETTGNLVYKIKASITLASTVAGTTITTPIPKVLDFDLKIPEVKVPEVFVGSIGKNFGQGKDNRYGLMIIGRSTGIASLADLNTILDSIKTLLANLKPITQFGLSSIADGVSTIVDAIEAALPNVAFAAKDEIKNLNDYTIYQGAWWENDLEAEDTFESALIISGSDKGMICYRDKNLKGDEVRFFVQKGFPLGICVCNDLGKSDVVTGFGGASSHKGTTDFYRRISSLKWW